LISNGQTGTTKAQSRNSSDEINENETREERMRRIDAEGGGSTYAHCTTMLKRISFSLISSFSRFFLSSSL